jgi:hypothetical protein
MIGLNDELHLLDGMVGFYKIGSWKFQEPIFLFQILIID